MRNTETEPAVGAPVTLRQRKWDGTPHRRASMVYLGSDEYGGWLTNSDRSQFPVDVGVRDSDCPAGIRAHVMLIPYNASYLAHFNTPPNRTSMYTDVTTTPSFDRDGAGWLIAVVDMDLDVVRDSHGDSWIEDEEEFAAHTVRYRYPADVVARSRAAAADVLAAVRQEAAPFGTTWRRWVDRVDAVLDDVHGIARCQADSSAE